MKSYLTMQSIGKAQGMDAAKAGKFLYQIKLECNKQEKTINFVQYLLVQIKAFFGCPKAVFVPVDKDLVSMVANDVLRD